jgi:glycosyltransferase involved in cell wall biosynthesis
MSGPVMRVAFTLDPYATAGGGSVSFARVLADALPGLGIEVLLDRDAPADVVLVFAQHATGRLLARHRARGARILHRLDERIDPHESGGRRRKHRRILGLNAWADVTVFQSEFVRRNVGPFTSAPASCVIHNGVDPGVFSPTGPSVALAGAPVALHVSWSVGASKRLDRIAELLDASPPGLRVYCAGRHAETRAAWLADPRVTVLGPRPRDEIAALMRSADFLFFPSELEPCPNTPLEAMASGLPVLYHASGGTPELLGEAGVPIGASLGHALGRLLGARAELRSQARARAPRFHADRAAREYAESMQVAVARPSRRAPSAMRRLWSLYGL